MRSIKSLKILVVEDHPFQRKTVLRMLRAIGAHDVMEAADGARALELIAGKDGVDVVISDLNMPGMDGMEFIRHVGTANYAVSFIITSAQSRSLLNSVETMTKAYGVALLGIIEKPVSRISLEELLAQHLPFAPQPKLAGRAGPEFSLEEIQDGIRNHQFEPFFQPKFDLANGVLVGAEALARWRTVEHGVVAPSVFIPQLEQNRQIDDLTYLILEQSALACRSWHQAGHAIHVSVNLSMNSLNEPLLAERITRIVTDSGLDPVHMILEVTETMAMTQVAPALENLARLRMHGFGLAIDDYGTGFSSLSQLARVAFTELKIDKTFVTGCADNPSCQAIVNSSVDLANRLELVSVAEGIETQDDIDTLRLAGCQIGQGYFFAKPMDGNQFLKFCVANAPTIWPQTSAMNGDLRIPTPRHHRWPASPLESPYQPD